MPPCSAPPAPALWYTRNRRTAKVYIGAQVQHAHKKALLLNNYCSTLLSDQGRALHWVPWRISTIRLDVYLSNNTYNTSLFNTATAAAAATNRVFAWCSKCSSWKADRVFGIIAQQIAKLNVDRPAAAPVLYLRYVRVTLCSALLCFALISCAMGIPYVLDCSYLTWPCRFRAVSLHDVY